MPRLKNIDPATDTGAGATTTGAETLAETKSETPLETRSEQKAAVAEAPSPCGSFITRGSSTSTVKLTTIINNAQ